MLQAYKGFWKNCFNFKGRSNRRDYWLASAMNVVIFLLIIAIIPEGAFIYLLVTFIPTLALSIRRLHDINKSGLLAIIFTIPYILYFLFFNYLNSYVPDENIPAVSITVLVITSLCSIVLIVLLCLPSFSQNNKYGDYIYVKVEEQPIKEPPTKEKLIANKVYQADMDKRSKRCANISFILAIIPVLLLIFCVLYSQGEGEDGNGAVGWLLILYYATVGIPIAVASFITGIISLNIRKNILAIIGIIIASLPLLFLLSIHFS